MEFRILGPLQVLDGGRLLPLGGAKQRSTLALLLLGRNQVVSRDHLVDGLWGESPPPSAGPTLKTYVSRLRRVLDGNGHGDRLVTQPPGYTLRVEPGELDLERLEGLLTQARAARASGDPGAAADDLREGLSLFRGAPLEDLAHAPFAEVEIGRLDDLRLSALEERLDADLAAGRCAEVAGELESLAARHPFRENLWGQLMVALYRSGRQGEALNAFDRARRTLADELGVYPGETLNQLHRQILEHDPALEPATASAASVAVATATVTPEAGYAARSDESTSAPSAAPSDGFTAPPIPPRRDNGRPPRPPDRRRRALALAIPLIVVGTLVAILVPRLVEAGGGASATYRPGTALIDLATGHEIASIPHSRLAVAAYPLFAGGHFWVINWLPNGYIEIDPKAGAILNQVSQPARDPTVHGDSATNTPWVIAGKTLWVTSADDLVKMDVGLDGLGRELARFKLDDLGTGTGLAEGVAVGGGSLWVSRDVGRGQILRLDPTTGRPEHVWNDISPYLNLAYGDGALWAADERGLIRIDAETNRLTRVDAILGNCPRGDGGCVAVGAGFGWTSDGTRGVVDKIDDAGRIAATYSTGIGTGYMAYADGVLWVGNHDSGTVTGIDAVTGRKTATYRFGHPVDDIAAGGGVLLASLAPGRTVDDRIDSLGGGVPKFFAHGNELGDGAEPALDVDQGAYQIDFATGAGLLNYPDKPPPRGLRLRPEVAAAMPTVSRDGRTYTFKVRPGYRFSPPSNQRVTAETVRYSIERALSPRLARNATGQVPPGPRVVDDIEGETAFRAGTAAHISGLRARGDTLSITLTKPSPDFLERLALPFFSPVPRGTAAVAGAPRGTRPNGSSYIPSAGPYYVADYADGYVILRRNPNYNGPRPHALDAIAIREGVDASAALESVQNHGWNGITSLSDPVLDPGRAADRRWGTESAAAARGDQRYFSTPEAGTRFIAFNTTGGIFADRQVRRAAALALDRAALATASNDLPTDQLLSSALPGFRDRVLYPVRASATRARALMDGRRRRAVMPVPSGCDRCTEVADIVRTDLAAIGIDVEVRALDDYQAALKQGTPFDLLDADAGIAYPDSASFLARLVHDVPPGWVSPRVRANVKRVASLTGDRRQGAAAALADRLATTDVSVAAYGTPQTGQFVGPRIGCRAFTPVGHGLDLAGLCVKSSSG